MTPRAALLAVTSAAGLLLARVVDGLGVLPGVAEPDAVRRAALDPRLTAVGLLGCLVVGLVAERLLVRAPLAVAALVGGQLGLVMALEEGGRALSGAPHGGGGETGLWLAVAVQALLAALAVATALVVLALPGRAFGRPASTSVEREVRFPAYRLVVAIHAGGSERDRAPPVGC